MRNNRGSNPTKHGVPFVHLICVFSTRTPCPVVLTQAISLMKQAQRASAGSDTVAEVLDASAWRLLLAGLASAGLNAEAGLAMQAMVEAGVPVDKVRAFFVGADVDLIPAFCSARVTCDDCLWCVLLARVALFRENDSRRCQAAEGSFLGFVWTNGSCGCCYCCCCCCCVFLVVLVGRLEFAHEQGEHGERVQLLNN